MVTVGLNLGQASAGAVADRLESAGFTVVDEGPEIVVVEAVEMDDAEVAAIVNFVVDGGGLLVCGGMGPLSAALHLTPGPDAIEGAVEPAQAGLPPVAVAAAHPVTGPGYALYRIGKRCVALGGPRGSGCIAAIGSFEPDLAAGALEWIRAQLDGGAR